MPTFSPNSVYLQDVATGKKDHVINFVAGNAVWDIARSRLKSSGLSRLVFEYIKGARYTSAAAFDDVHISACSDLEMAENNSKIGHHVIGK